MNPLDPTLFGEIDPPQRLLMGPGPVNAHPRVLRAMSADLLGQFDPEMTGFMNQVMALYRPVFGTENQWTMLIDGTARAAIEASLVSLVEPGDTVLVVNFGRFGLLLTEILTRLGAKIEQVSVPWGEVVPLEAVAEAIERYGPKVVATVHGDTSTTMAQPRSPDVVQPPMPLPLARTTRTSTPDRALPSWTSRAHTCIVVRRVPSGCRCERTGFRAGDRGAGRHL